MYEIDPKICKKSIRGFPYNIPLSIIIGPIILIPLISAFLLFWTTNELAFNKLIYSTIISLIAMIVGIILIPNLKTYTLKADIYGIDLNKPGMRDSKPWIPEAAGIITSIVFLIAST